MCVYVHLQRMKLRLGSGECQLGPVRRALRAAAAGEGDRLRECECSQ